MAFQQEEKQEKQTCSIETERSFILNPEGYEEIITFIEGAPYEDITQIYEIPVDQDGNPTGARGYRYRALVTPDGKTLFTKNIKHQTEVAGQQVEDEKAIRKKVYNRQFDYPFYGPVTKRRFHTLGFEVDLFGPPFDGFIKIEREKKGLGADDFFYHPYWMEEVTDDSGFSNRRLVRNGVPLGTPRFDTRFLLEKFCVVTPDNWSGKQTITHGWHTDTPTPLPGAPVPLWERHWHVPLDKFENGREDYLYLLSNIVGSVCTDVSDPSFYKIGFIEASQETTVQILQKNTPPMRAHHLKVKRGNEKGRTVPITRKLFDEYALRVDKWYERIRFKCTLEGTPVDIDIYERGGLPGSFRALISTSFQSIKERNEFVQPWNAQEILLT